MSYECQHRYWIEATRITGKSITFCSCVLIGTQVEQTSSKREPVIMWAKDIAASAGLILFMVSAFVLASGAHAILGPI
jgi:diacylglycerol kinase